VHRAFRAARELGQVDAVRRGHHRHEQVILVEVVAEQHALGEAIRVDRGAIRSAQARRAVRMVQHFERDALVVEYLPY
jgi:hypothetical protein